MTMSPAEFALLVLGLELYPWQVEAVEACGARRRTALVAANGSGKTACVNVVLLLWFLYTHPKGIAMVTSGSWTQLKTQLWPNLKEHAARFPAWQFLDEQIRTPEGGFIRPYSTDSPGRAEGHHQKLPERPVMLMADEAKSVPDAIFDAINRCTPTYLIYTSSPGAPQGTFYNAFRAARGLYHTVKATAFDCPHISRERIETAKALYGPEPEKNPIYRSMILAEFSEGDDALFIPPALIERALAHPPMAKDGELYAATDWAAGGDETVTAIRHGNMLRILSATRERNTMRAAEQVVGLLRAHKVPPSQAVGDAAGLGLPIMQAASTYHGYRMVEFNGGAPAARADYYKNLNAEAWTMLRMALERGEVRFEGGLDSVSIEQLTTRRVEWTDRGVLRCESKECMQARGLHSPDRADALVMAWWAGRNMRFFNQDGSLPPRVSLPPRNPFALPVITDFRPF